MGVFMYSIKIETNTIHLPPAIFQKIQGKKAQLIETEEGILIHPINENISKARGILKGSPFNSKTFIEQKKSDKTFES